MWRGGCGLLWLIATEANSKGREFSIKITFPHAAVPIQITLTFRIQKYIPMYFLVFKMPPYLTLFIVSSAAV